MGKGMWFVLALAILGVALFLYDESPGAIGEHIREKRAPLERRGKKKSKKKKNKKKDKSKKSKKYKDKKDKYSPEEPEEPESEERGETEQNSNGNSNPTEADYQELYDVIKEHITQEKSEPLIPHFLRSAFHDAMHFDGKKHGPEGCIFHAPAADFPENEVRFIISHQDLVDKNEDLARDVRTKFKDRVNFSLGDMVSMSGKVSIEMAFKCVRVDWSGGRGRCNLNDPTPSQGPPPNVNTEAGINLLLDRYGFTAKEFALMTLGGHAVRHGDFKPWKFGGRDSVPLYIKDITEVIFFSNGEVNWEFDDHSRTDLSISYLVNS
jgi:hypothetical protein